MILSTPAEEESRPQQPDVVSALPREFWEELANVRSEQELIGHPYYQRYKKSLHQTLRSYEMLVPDQEPQRSRTQGIRVASWNIERGKAYEGIVHALKTQPDLAISDILVLTEVDHGMGRSKNRHVAKELAKELNLYGVFAPSYLNLSKGHGGEESTTHENTLSLQGHAILSRYPIVAVELIHLVNTKDHMRGPEKQIGQEVAIVATVRTPISPLHVVAIHLEAHSSRRQRVEQMNQVLCALSNKAGPVLLGGDWNTTTFDVHPPRKAFVDFCRKAVVGRRKMFEDHYPYPDRHFEKALFSKVSEHGFGLDDFNVAGAFTSHFDFRDPQVRLAIGDWLPSWAFRFVDWALQPRNGYGSLKLDWFAGRELEAKNALIVGDLSENGRAHSDHDAIVVDLQFKTPKGPPSSCQTH